MEKTRYDGLVPIHWVTSYGGRSAQIEISNQQDITAEKVCVKISFEEDEQFRELRRGQVNGSYSASTDPFSSEIISDRDFIVMLIDTLEQVEQPLHQPSVKFYQIVVQYDNQGKICAMLVDTQGRRYKISVPLAFFIQAQIPDIELFANKNIFRDCGEKS